MTHTNEHGQPIGFPVVEWTHADLPTRKPLFGRYAQLESVTNLDLCAGLFDAFVEDAKGLNWTYLPYGPFETLADFTRWFEGTCLKDDPLFYGIRDLSTNATIGLASFLRIEPVAGSIEVGHIHFSPLMQRTPLSTEAMYLMMKHVFDDLHYRRYEWKCDALNKPSMRAAQRLGFTFEGIFRQALTYKQRNRDTAWLSITDKEWPAIKAGFELWLQPDNFDESGMQKMSLGDCRIRAND